MGFCMSLGMVCEKWGNHGVQSLDATWMQIHMHSTWMYEKHCCKKNHVGLGCVSNKTADLNGDFIGWKTGFVVCNSDGPLDGLLKMGWTFDGPLYDGYFTSMAREKCVSLSSLYEKHHPIIYDMIKIFTTRWTDYLQIKNHLYSLLVGACRMRHCCLVLDQPPATCSILNQRNCQSGSTLEVKRRFGGVFIYIYISCTHNISTSFSRKRWVAKLQKLAIPKPAFLARRMLIFLEGLQSALKRFGSGCQKCHKCQKCQKCHTFWRYNFIN